MADLQQRLDAIFNNGELTNQEKVEEMYKFYTAVVFEEFKATHQQMVKLKLQEELNTFRLGSVYTDQIKRAQLILQKYEVLTREYQSQNKKLKDNHESIIKGEQEKREQIIANFENHLKQIREQIREDAKKLEEDGGGEVVRENQQLQTQYDALMKEIEEKSKLMDEQIADKTSSGQNIEEEMTAKILLQEQEIKKQIEVYSAQAKIKTEEEAQLVSVLADYKKKYEEFSAAMKKSAKTFKVYEAEIKNMNTRALELATIKRKLLQGEGGGAGKKKKGKQAAADEPSAEKKNQEVDKLLAEWAEEKRALEREKEELAA